MVVDRGLIRHPEAVCTIGGVVEVFGDPCHTAIGGGGDWSVVVVVVVVVIVVVSYQNM